MMKAFVALVLLACLQEIQAQDYSFVAKKGHQSIVYLVGAPLRIQLQNDSFDKVKGYYSKAASDGIYLLPFDKKDTVLRFVPFSHIKTVVRLERKARRDIVIASGAGLALTGGLVAVAGTSSLRTPMGYILFIPAFASATILFYGLPIFYAKEFISKKSTRNGWRFTIQ